MIALRRLAVAGIDRDHLQAGAGALRDVLKSRRPRSVCAVQQNLPRLDQTGPERLGSGAIMQCHVARPPADVGTPGPAGRISKRYQRAIAIDDVGLGGLDLQLFLPRGDVAEDADRNVLEGPGKISLAEGRVMFLRRRLDDIGRDWTALRLV